MSPSRVKADYYFQTVCTSMPLKVKGVRVDGAAAVLGTCNSVK